MAQMGRPRQFDRDAAITESMHLFWEHGYESTSLSQLKAGIGGGITAPSFYAAFGSKEALFREVVARYLATHGQVNESLWDLTLPPRVAIETALRRSAAMQCEAGHPRGCMVALGVRGTCTQDAGGADPLAASRARTRAGFLACVERGIESGELDDDSSAPALASVFDSFLTGLSTLARDGVEYPVLEGAIARVMAVWDAAATRPGR